MPFFNFGTLSTHWCQAHQQTLVPLLTMQGQITHYNAVKPTYGEGLSLEAVDTDLGGRLEANYNL